MSNENGLEIERKFLIVMPDIAELSGIAGAEVSEITQTYLLAEPEVADRVRKRSYESKVVYTRTVKKRVSGMSAFEDEKVISEEEYTQLLVNADKSKIPVKKTRCAIPFKGHILEIDIYPFWHKQAVLEIELDSEQDTYCIPDYLKVIREVTGNRAYSNRALSGVIPDED